MDEPAAIADEIAMLGQYLSGRDTPCPSCGYNLRDLQSQRCPECAQDLELSVKLVEPRQGALIAGLIGLSAGLGLSGMSLVFLVTFTAIEGLVAGPATVPLLAVLCTMVVVDGVAVWLWVRNWRRIRRLKASTKYLLVASCWGLAMANLVTWVLDYLGA